MLIVRASQNGPYLTVKFEAKAKDQYELLRKQVSDILRRYNEVNFSKGVNTDSLQ